MILLQKNSKQLQVQNPVHTNIDSAKFVIFTHILLKVVKSKTSTLKMFSSFSALTGEAHL